jgi:alpha-methylacyl-CoA racemase
MHRGKRSVTLDLKTPDATAAALDLARRADGLIEGFRPGVMERLGLGPDAAIARHPRLVYGRMTGWGQEGPLAPRAGHDINYISRVGVLAAIGRKDEAPVPPLNLVGDFGGGGMLLAFGMACALLEASRSGRGQVVDAAMVDGTSLLATMFHGLIAGQAWIEERGANLLDGAAPWYGVYETSDGLHVSVGAIEGRFYADLLERLGLAGEPLPPQHDRAGWTTLRRRFAAVFASRTRAHWEEVFRDADACVAPVLNFSEARRDPHALARGAFQAVDGIEQPAPAPRFSRTPGAVRGGPPERGQGGSQALLDWGCTSADVDRLRAQGVGFNA